MNSYYFSDELRFPLLRNHEPVVDFTIFRQENLAAGIRPSAKSQRGVQYRYRRVDIFDRPPPFLYPDLPAHRRSFGRRRYLEHVLETGGQERHPPAQTHHPP